MSSATLSSVNVDVPSARQHAAICGESWEFRKICAEGSVFPNAFTVVDIDEDGHDEIVIGTTEGQLVVMMPDQRNPIFQATLAATIAATLYSSRRRQLLVITLEGQCELREAPTPMQFGKSSALQRKSGAARPAAFPNSCGSNGGSPSLTTSTEALPIVSRMTIPANCWCADVDEAGTTLFLGSSDRRVYLYQMSTRTCVGSVFLQSQVFSVSTATVLPGVSLLLIGSTTDLVMLDADAPDLRSGTSRRVDLEENFHSATGTDDDASIPPCVPAWHFRFQRDAHDSSHQHHATAAAAAAAARDAPHVGSLADRSVQRTFRSSLQLSSPYTFLSGRGGGRNVRLPVAVEWLIPSEGRAYVSAITEDGYVWLFHLWSEGRCIADPDATTITLGKGKPVLSLVNVWRQVASVRLFRSMIQRVALLRHSVGDKLLVVALATDGTCFMLDSARNCTLAQLRPDVCSFSVLHRGDQVLLLCVTVDEIIAYVVTPPNASLPSGTQCVPWDAQERNLLLRVGGELFPDVKDTAELLAKVEVLLSHGLMEEDWERLGKWSGTDDADGQWATSST